MRPVIWSETIDMIVDDYRKGEADRDREAEWWAADGFPFDEVLDRVGRARTRSGLRHGHQRRLSQSAILGSVERLNALSGPLQAAKDFHEVFTLIEAAFKPVRGAGELAVYDAANRICERLGHVSPHIVYLHAGARIGARRLLGGRLANGDAWGIFRHQLPEGLWDFSTHEVEDILCIYKDDFLLSPEALSRKWVNGGPGACASRGMGGVC
jgi:hypothetical protein